jgi:hypothetical protein
MNKGIKKIEYLRVLYGLLSMRKDKRYRKGLLQGAVSFGVIDQPHWKLLTDKYIKNA